MSVVKVAREKLRPDPKQVRKEFPEESLAELREVLKVQGQLVPLIILPDGMIVDGERRWRCGLPEYDCIVMGKDMSPSQAREIQLVTSLQKEGLSAWSLYSGFADWFKENSGKEAKDLAVRVGRSAGFISKVRSLERCIPAAQEAAKGGLIGVSDWYAMSQVDERTQHEMLAAKKNGGSREEIERKGRRARNGLGEEPKVGKVKIPCLGGEAVLMGINLGMDEVVAMLEGLLKEARKAAGHYDVKTWAAMMRDKSKAG